MSIFQALGPREEFCDKITAYNPNHKEYPQEE